MFIDHNEVLVENLKHGGQGCETVPLMISFYQTSYLTIMMVNYLDEKPLGSSM